MRSLLFRALSKVVAEPKQAVAIEPYDTSQPELLPQLKHLEGIEEDLKKEDDDYHQSHPKDKPEDGIKKAIKEIDKDKKKLEEKIYLW